MLPGSAVGAADSEPTQAPKPAPRSLLPPTTPSRKGWLLLAVCSIQAGDEAMQCLGLSIVAGTTTALSPPVAAMRTPRNIALPASESTPETLTRRATSRAQRSSLNESDMIVPKPASRRPTDTIETQEADAMLSPEDNNVQFFCQAANYLVYRSDPTVHGCTVGHVVPRLTVEVRNEGSARRMCTSWYSCMSLEPLSSTVEMISWNLTGDGQWLVPNSLEQKQDWRVCVDTLPR